MGQLLSRGTQAVLAMATVVAVVFTGAAAATAAPRVFTDRCFGYEGRFLGDPVLRVDLQGGWRECFGIGTNRGIWHAWPNSGGWREMPHRGRADNVTIAFFNEANQRTIMVYTNGRGYYCSSNRGTWQPWVNC